MPNPWGAYNDAARRWMTSDGAGAARAAADARADAPADVRRALDGLRQ
eukprot:gene31123-64461_t